MIPNLYPDKPYGFLKGKRTEISASTATVCSTVITFPMDSIKSRLQAYPASYKGAVDCALDTHKKEGFPGFFRGLLVPLASITFVRTLSFSVYSKTKHSLNNVMTETLGVNPTRHVATKGTLPTWYTVTCFGIAGGVAGAAATFVACPMELTKLTEQLSAKMSADSKGYKCPERKAIAASYLGKGPVGTLVTIAQQRGFAGLYTGFPLHMIRDTIGTGIYFAAYESSKHVFSTAFNMEPTNNAVVYLSGGVSGIASWMLIYPLDRAKAEYQREALELPRRKAPLPPKITWFKRRSYRGLGVSMTRSFVINMLFFGIYENVKKTIDRLPDDKNFPENGF
ncbi:integral membrane ornithine transporter of mitochondria [Zalerion maritima]|uniref:Integral membrane ornithine transporter of mitochondria n=1 Tax=Zalerion maritima TaxID=339359 RepID=A0AAD5RLE1_9PEZI|nr:integral membrane ornithine transporter of mitochondria [Zalerion maritima]